MYGRPHFLDCIRAPPKRGRYWEIHPRRPRDFMRPERFPEGEARGKSRGDGFPNTSLVLVEYGHSLIINISTGSGSENPSLWRGKDWQS